MGILDEAIREHLDLKRRRGADETEIARQEGEVFGPSRRAAEAPESPPVGPAAALDEPAVAYEDAPPPARPADAPTMLAEPAETNAAAAPPAHLHLADPEPPSAEVPAPATWSSAPPAEAPPVPPSVTPAPPPDDHLSQPTRAFDPEEVRAAAGAEPEPEIVPADEESEGDDVLEETPEFLQETPEHDRLWFEQRPPRDFDF